MTATRKPASRKRTLSGNVNGDEMGNESSQCPDCGVPTYEGMKFCGECGAKTPTVRVVSDPHIDDVPGVDGQDDEGPVEIWDTNDEPLVPAQKSKKKLVIAGTAALGLGLLGASVWGITQASQAKEQYEASAPVLVKTIDSAGSASSISMVHAVAEQANGELTVIQATVSADPNAKGVDQLQQMEAAFEIVASLREYSMRDTDVWTDQKDNLQQTLDTLAAYGGQTATVADEGDQMILKMDEITTLATKKIKKYERECDKVRNERKGDKAALRSYRQQMQSLIADYVVVRNETNTSDLVNSDAPTYEVEEHFTEGMDRRRSIRAAMASLEAPASVSDEHATLIDMLDKGVEGMTIGLSSVTDADCEYSLCLLEESQWDEYQTISEQNSNAIQGAIDAWQAAVKGQTREITSQKCAKEPKDINV